MQKRMLDLTVGRHTDSGLCLPSSGVCVLMPVLSTGLLATSYVPPAQVMQLCLCVSAVLGTLYSTRQTSLQSQASIRNLQLCVDGLIAVALTCDTTAAFN